MKKIEDPEEKKRRFDESQKRYRDKNKDKIKVIAHKAYETKKLNHPEFRAMENKQKRDRYNWKKLKNIIPIYLPDVE